RSRSRKVPSFVRRPSGGLIGEQIRTRTILLLPYLRKWRSRKARSRRFGRRGLAGEATPRQKVAQKDPIDQELSSIGLNEELGSIEHINLPRQAFHHATELKVQQDTSSFLLRNVAF